jgi:hypothetical protein
MRAHHGEDWVEPKGESSDEVEAEEAVSVKTAVEGDKFAAGASL